MSYATVFMMWSFIAELLLTLYYFWTINEMPETNTNTTEGKFKSVGVLAAGYRKSIFIFIISLLLFFIFYGSLMVSMVDVTNVYDSSGNIKNTLTNEDWRLGWEFLKIIFGLVWINAGVLAWRIMHQTQIIVSLFGSKANKNKKWARL